MNFKNGSKDNIFHLPHLTLYWWFTAVYLQLWIAVCDYLLLIIAKKHFNIPQTLHTISKSIGPLLFKQDDIRSIFKVTKELSINSPESQYIEGYLF